MNFFAKVTVVAFLFALTVQPSAQVAEAASPSSSAVVVGTFSGSVGSLAGF